MSTLKLWFPSAFILLSAFCSASESLQVLELGQPFENSISAESAVIQTASLGKGDPEGHPSRGASHGLRVAQSGTFTLEVDSSFRDCLVLRAADGTVLAEDEFSRWGVMPRIVATLEAGVDYRVDVVSRYGVPGSYTLTVSAGKPAREADSPAVAIESLRGRLAALEEAGAEPSPALANAVYRLGYLLTGGAGDMAEGEALLVRAMELREAALGEHPLTAVSCEALAFLRREQGRLDLALELTEKAVAIAEKVFGADHATTATYQVEKAELIYWMGRFAESAELSLKALAILERDQASPQDLAWCMNTAAFSLLSLGRFADSLAVLEKLYPITKDPELLTAIGRVHFELGDYAEARIHLEKALTALRGKPGLARGMNDLGAVASAEGNYEEACRTFRRALEVVKESGDDSTALAARLLHNLGWALSYDGKFEQARESFEAALGLRRELFGDQHMLVAQTLDNLGRTYFEEGKLEEAEAPLRQALAIREKALGAEHPITAFSYYNIATFEHEADRLEDARASYDRALAVRMKTLGELHPDTARTLVGLTRLQADTGKLDDAWERSRQAMRAGREQIDRVLWILTEAERLTYADLFEVGLELHLSLARERGDEASRAAAYDELLGWKGQVSRSVLGSRARILRKWTDAENRKLERLDAIQSQLARIFHEKADDDVDELESKLEELRLEKVELERDILRVAGRDESKSPSVKGADVAAVIPAKSVVVDFYVHRWYEPRAVVDDEPVRGMWSEPHLSAWVTTPGAAGPVHVDLGPEIEIRKATQDYLRSLIKSRGVASAEDEDDPATILRELLWDPLAAHVGKAKTVFVSPDGFLGSLPFETVVIETGEFLIEKHGFVYLQDIASLPGIVAKPRSPVTTKASVAGEEGKSIGGLLCIGGVDFRKRGDLAWQENPASAGSGTGESALPSEFPTERTVAMRSQKRALRRSDNTWVPLMFSGPEANAVVGLHEESFEDTRGRLLLRGQDATEERLVYEMPRHEIVHLATHGFFNPTWLTQKWGSMRVVRGKRRIEMRDVPRKVSGNLPGLLSGVVLAGSNRRSVEDRDDGLLTAEEISYLDLSRVNLVTLSACETGLGDPRGGEGMLGFRRELRLAGVSTVISSLWSIDDEKTMELMQLFYERLWLDEDSKLEALRGAQLDMLKRNMIENDGETLPATWGAFVLDGDWR